jgi:quercetin dioxygenase-like cupin family protein
MASEERCFSELAPLYTLDLLDEEERRWVKEQIVDCPDLAIELAEFEDAVGNIPYSTPAVPMATDLKDRLFQRIGEEMPERSPITPNKIPDTIVRSQDLDWQPGRAPGVTMAIFHVDPLKRQIVGVLKAEPGARYPLHRHRAIEEIYMLEGDLRIGEEVYRAGDYIRSNPGTIHAPETRDGCMFFFHASLDDEYLEEDAAMV